MGRKATSCCIGSGEQGGESVNAGEGGEFKINPSEDRPLLRGQEMKIAQAENQLAAATGVSAEA